MRQPKKLSSLTKRYIIILLCIADNFRGAQFARIGVFKNFAETIFADQGFHVI